MKKEHRLHSGMKYRPTLIIGLGGVGTNIARYTYGWIQNITAQKSLPPFIKILAFDTDGQVTGKKDNMPHLTPDTQFVKIGGFSAGNLLNAYKKDPDNPRLKYLKPFIDVDLRPGQIHRGAHGIPMIGRLCYAYNRNAKIISALSSNIMELLSITLPYTAKNKGYVLQSGEPTLNIHLVGSVCGGTGAGILLDTAFDIRQLVLNHSNCDPDIVAHLVLPPVFDSHNNPLKDLHYRNAYYMLRQIEYLVGGDREEYAEIISSKGQISELKRYETLFDMIYLVNKKIKNKEKTERIIGRMISSLILEPIGREINSMWDNMRSDKLGKKPVKAYSGYSLITFKPPSKEYQENLVKRRYISDFYSYVEETIKHPPSTNRMSKVYTEAIKPSCSMPKECIISGDKINEDWENQEEMNQIRDKYLVDTDYVNKQLNPTLEFFWKEVKKRLRNNDIETFLAIMQWIKNGKNIIDSDIQIKKNDLDELINDFYEKINSDDDGLDSDKIRRDSAPKIAEKITEINKLMFEAEVILRINQHYIGILSGKLLLDTISYCIKEIRKIDDGNEDAELLDRKIGDIEGIVDIDVARGEEKDFSEEYISLVKWIIDCRDSNEYIRDKVYEWVYVNENGFFKSYKVFSKINHLTAKFFEDIIMSNPQKIKEAMEQPKLPLFLLNDVVSGSEVKVLPFIQSSMHDREDEGEKDYISCYVDPQCDWILCNTVLGFELENIKDFTTEYYTKYFNSIKNQPLLWTKPLFSLKTNDNTGDEVTVNEQEEMKKIFGFSKEEMGNIKNMVNGNKKDTGK